MYVIKIINIVYHREGRNLLPSFLFSSILDTIIKKGKTYKLGKIQFAIDFYFLKRVQGTLTNNRDLLIINKN